MSVVDADTGTVEYADFSEIPLGTAKPPASAPPRVRSSRPRGAGRPRARRTRSASRGSPPSDDPGEDGPADGGHQLQALAASLAARRRRDRAIAHLALLTAADRGDHRAQALARLRLDQLEEAA